MVGGGCVFCMAQPRHSSIATASGTNGDVAASLRLWRPPHTRPYRPGITLFYATALSVPNVHLCRFGCTLWANLTFCTLTLSTLGCLRIPYQSHLQDEFERKFRLHRAPVSKMRWGKARTRTVWRSFCARAVAVCPQLVAATAYKWEGLCCLSTFSTHIHTNHLTTNLQTINSIFDLEEPSPTHPYQ